MLKVMVFDRCGFCDGEAYVYSSDRTDEDGNQSPVYLPMLLEVMLSREIASFDEAANIAKDSGVIGKKMLPKNNSGG
jgi:hypothetical protein